MHWVKAWVESFKSSLHLKKIILVLIVLLSILSLTLFIIFVSMKLFNFLATNFIPILCVFGGYIWLYQVFKDRQQKKQQNIVSLQELKQEKKTELEQIRAEDDYKLIRQYLYLVLADISDTVQLRMPKIHSELDTPNHYIVKNGVNIYQYIIAKNNTSLTTDEIKDVLTRRIEQRLKEQQFPGINQSYYIHTSGIRYPIFLIDSISDMGAYYQLDIAFCGLKFCDYLETKAYAKYDTMQNQNSQPRDEDF